MCNKLGWNKDRKTKRVKKNYVDKPEELKQYKDFKLVFCQYFYFHVSN